MNEEKKSYRKSLRFYLSRPNEAYAYRQLKTAPSAANLAASAICIYTALYKQGPYATIAELKKELLTDSLSISSFVQASIREQITLETGYKNIGFGFSATRLDHMYAYRILKTVKTPTHFLSEAILVYQALFGQGPYAILFREVVPLAFTDNTQSPLENTTNMPLTEPKDVSETIFKETEDDIYSLSEDEIAAYRSIFGN